jgi:hypothetical protein
MTTIEKNIEHQRYLKGDVQKKAEENLQKQMEAPFETLIDSQTGKEHRYKKPVADIFVNRKTHERPKKVFTVPDLSGIDWNN